MSLDAERNFCSCKKYLILLQFVNYRFCYIFVKSIGIQIVVVPLWRLVLKLLNKIEDMCKKSSIVLLFVAVSSFVVSCIDKNYDLANKEIATDVKLDSNTVVLPVGGLRPVLLDSLVDVDSIEILGKDANGVYSININDSISLLEEKIEPVSFNIAPLSEEVKIEFEAPEISSIHIEETFLNSAKFNTPSVSLKRLNESLKDATLESNITKSISNDALDVVFNILESGVLTPEFLPDEVEIKETVSVVGQKVGCNFSYELPTQIEKIDNIKLASVSGDTSHGALVEVVVEHPKALEGVDKSIDFEIIFPDMFLLSKASDEYELSEDRHTISVKNLVPTAADESHTYLRFYIDELAGIADKTNDGVVNIDETITYSVYYSVDGTIKIDKANVIKREDFEFDIALSAPLRLRDVSGRTKEIEVPLTPITMKFDTHVDDLQYIDTIKYVKLDSERSSFNFMTLMDDAWFDGFTLADGYALKIAFPENIYFEDSKSQYYGKGEGIVYEPEEHAYYVYDLRAVGNEKWVLAIDSFAVNLPVVDGECDLTTEFSVYCVKNGEKTDYLKIAAIELESMSAALDKLEGTKTVGFNVLESYIYVDDAAVCTNAIPSDLNSKTEFKLNEKIPAEIGRINSIDFDEAAAVKFDMEISGLEHIDADINLDLRVAMPSFLRFTLPDERNPNNSSVDIEVIGDTMYVKAGYNSISNNVISFELLCDGLDFMTGEFGNQGLCPKVVDGDNYISHTGHIAVDGNAVIGDMELHSKVLDELKDIRVNVNVAIDEIEIKRFHGIYNAKIDDITETVELTELGDGLDFLRNEENSIILADPQIEIVLTNSVSLPIDAYIQILGKDESGKEIPTACVELDNITILPAKYDEATGNIIPDTTKFFFTSNVNEVSKFGYNNIEIANLDSLLKEIPHSFEFNIKPAINTNATHHIDISEPVKLDGAYSVVVPLKFDDLHLCYCDTVDGLDANLGETVKMFSNVSVNVKMDIVNTIPVSLSLKAVPLDADGNVIDDIEIDELKIAAGNGESLLNDDGVLNDSLPVQAFRFAIRSKSGDISSLDGLAFSLEAASDHTTGSAAISGEQGIKISNVVFEVSGDIEADLKDLGL